MEVVTVRQIAEDPSAPDWARRLAASVVRVERDPVDVLNVLEVLTVAVARHVEELQELADALLGVEVTS